ncbi:Bax inhibitor-1/YccA family membrane protein [Rhodovibrio salinarum]|nr:Bax inhibitor-1/YccA family protein [Rhodovibrio salinarum]
MIGQIPLGSPLMAPKAPASGGGWAFRPGEATATRAGALRATVICAVLFVAGYALLWVSFYPALAQGAQATVEGVRNVAFACGVAAFGGACATAYKPRLAPYVAPAVAVLGGVFGGGLALAFEQRYPGIAMQSMVVTSVVLAVLVGGYTTGVIQVTARFRAMAMIGAVVIALVYAARFVLWLVDLRLPVIHGAGWGGVLWTGFIVLVASLNFAVDLQRIDTLEDRRVPRAGEWYVALATTTTFIWLNISVLRLVARVRGT